MAKEHLDRGDTGDGFEGSGHHKPTLIVDVVGDPSLVAILHRTVKLSSHWKNTLLFTHGWGAAAEGTLLVIKCPQVKRVPAVVQSIVSSCVLHAKTIGVVLDQSSQVSLDKLDQLERLVREALDDAGAQADDIPFDRTDNLALEIQSVSSLCALGALEHLDHFMTPHSVEEDELTVLKVLRVHHEGHWESPQLRGTRSPHTRRVQHDVPPTWIEEYANFDVECLSGRAVAPSRLNMFFHRPLPTNGIRFDALQHMAVHTPLKELRRGENGTLRTGPYHGDEPALLTTWTQKQQRFHLRCKASWMYSEDRGRIKVHIGDGHQLSVRGTRVAWTSSGTLVAPKHIGDGVWEFRIKLLLPVLINTNDILEITEINERAVMIAEVTEVIE